MKSSLIFSLLKKNYVCVHIKLFKPVFTIGMGFETIHATQYFSTKLTRVKHSFYMFAFNMFENVVFEFTRIATIDTGPMAGILKHFGFYLVDPIYNKFI